MSDRRVTLVMTEGERDRVVAALEESQVVDLTMGPNCTILQRHLDRLRNARASQWPQR